MRPSQVSLATVTRGLILTLVLGAIALAARADAAFPPDPPNDPLFSPAVGCPPPLLPSPACISPTGQWNLLSYWPTNPPNGGHPSGISADLAWQTTIGRPDVTVVVLDSGVNYDHEDL